MRVSFWFLLFVAIVAVLALKRIKIVHEDQRLLVERLGRFHRVCGPGRRLVLPFVETAHLIRLNEALPEWTGLDEEQIHKRILEEFYGVERLRRL
jgi:regulator of protease activity HflC (stomatin/prohibitin superfamily)